MPFLILLAVAIFLIVANPFTYAVTAGIIILGVCGVLMLAMMISLVLVSRTIKQQREQFRSNFGRRL